MIGASSRPVFAASDGSSGELGDLSVGAATPMGSSKPGGDGEKGTVTEEELRIRRKLAAQASEALFFFSNIFFDFLGSFSSFSSFCGSFFFRLFHRAGTMACESSAVTPERSIGQRGVCPPEGIVRDHRSRFLTVPCTSVSPWKLGRLFCGRDGCVRGGSSREGKHASLLIDASFPPPPASPVSIHSLPEDSALPLALFRRVPEKLIAGQGGNDSPDERRASPATCRPVRGNVCTGFRTLLSSPRPVWNSPSPPPSPPRPSP